MNASSRQATELRAALARLRKLKANPYAGKSLPGQPFDLLLLQLSPAYRRSRKAYRKQGGRHLASFVSTPRTLSSAALLSNEIEYSPLEREYAWAATLPPTKTNDYRLLEIRTSVTSLFHEQNHRLLWQLLPPAPRDRAGLRRYLNLAESLVVVTDMGLADDLGTKQARDFYLSGTIYDPGTSVREEGLKGRMYRNYLQAALHATYLNLELFDPSRIPDVIEAMFPMIGPYARRAALRSLNLDRAFVEKTNPAWQSRNFQAVRASLSRELNQPGNHEPLVLPSGPMDNRQAYLIGESWFKKTGF